jgi:Secretion system C-terminal sorting domain
MSVKFYIFVLYKLKSKTIMKYNLIATLFTCIYCSATFAQVIINQSDFGLSTTTVDASQIKRTIKGGISLPTSGNNEIWDYTNLRDTFSFANSYREVTIPVTSPRPVLFATANTQSFVSRVLQGSYGSASWRYFRTDATGFYSLGDSSLFTRYLLRNGLDSITYLDQIREFKPAIQYYKFPMSTNTVWKNNSRFVTNILLKVSSLSLNNAPAQHVLITSSIDSVVGWGTLKMRSSTPGVILNFNALLVRSILIETDSFYFNGTPASSELLSRLELTQVSSTQNSVYFLASKFKAPYLTFLLNNSGSIEDIYRAILPDVGLAVRNEDLENIKVATIVFPNPITDRAIFEFEKTSLDDWRIFIYNENGQIIKNDLVKAPKGKSQHSINFDNDLPNGAYFYQIIDDNSLIRNTGKLILHHQ